MHTIEEFLADWKYESGQTARLMDALTDASLGQRVVEGDRSLGWTAWHIVTAMPEMLTRTGLKFTQVAPDAPRPATAVEIAAAYKAAAAEVADLVAANWTDASLQVKDEMYGEPWARSFTLTVLLRHEIHHRAQMTILMRQAGLRVPGVYGPAKEEWAQFGMQAPAVS